jgi:hypothetical protein
MLALAACASAPPVRLDPPPQTPHALAIVPGCPNLDDGTPSYCELGRAGWAAMLYRHGFVRAFVVSGGAVHSPYVEAETLATIMIALGVPRERIWLDPYALHTDENMWNGLQIARRLGVHDLAVASNGSQALSGCLFISDWGAQCTALGMNLEAMNRELKPEAARLRQLPMRRIDDWHDMGEQERARERRLGRVRPPSWVLYPFLSYLRAIGHPWQAIGPDPPPLLQLPP